MSKFSGPSLTRRPACRHLRISAPSRISRAFTDGPAMKDLCQTTVQSLLKQEEAFLASIAHINKIVLQPLLQADPDDAKGKELMRLLQLLNDRYCAVWDWTEENFKTLKQNFSQPEPLLSIDDIYIIPKREGFLDRYVQYFTSFTNFVVVQGFDRAAKQTSAHWKANKKTLKQFLVDSKGEPALPVTLYRVLHEPFRLHVQEYSLLLTKTSETIGKSMEKMQMTEALNQFEKLQTFISQILDEASLTKSLWNSLGNKITGVLCNPERRLIEDSNNVPVSTTAGRSERILLFDDILVLLQGYEAHTYDLKTVWVDSTPPEKPTTDTQTLRIITPEDEIFLSAKEPEHKVLWLWKLNQVIRQQLQGRRDFPLWSKNEDSINPPTCRFSTYTFRSEGRFKNATYEGDLSWGKPNGQGTLKWPGGRNHVGDFKMGKEDGFGICLVPSSSEDGYDCYKCHWREGQMEGYGICEYSNERVYKGYFQDSVRHGFGILETAVTDEHAFKYTGHWDSDKRKGYGVLDNSDSGERYIGMWQDNQRHGPGIVVTQSGACYQGYFQANKMTGPGVLLSEDDSLYEGEFTEEMHMVGKGKLTFQNGFTLVGTFSKNSEIGLQTQGVLNTARNREDYKTTRQIQLGADEIPVEMRWQGIYDQFQRFINSGCKEGTEEFYLGFHVQTSKELRKSQEYLFCQSREKEEVSGKIEDVLKEMWKLQDPEPLECYLEEAFKSSVHPLGKLLKTLVGAFQATYSGLGASKHLLDMAQEEVKHHANQIWGFCRDLLNMASQREGRDILEFENQEKRDMPIGQNIPENEDEEESALLNSSSLILPLILPRFYPELSMLYLVYHEREDALYWQGIVHLGLFSDTKLLEFLDVQKHFWPLKDLRLTTNQRHSLVRDRCFLSATECLQKIITTVNPREKLEILLKTYKEIESTVSRVVEKAYSLPMDDLLPLLVYVVSRARIQHLGAEIHFIRDLMDPENVGGIYDFMLTALESCYEYIQKEQSKSTQVP
ncbi:ALS2 C-terminal-like protein [Ambystoma mexicanum]|uniref:ALS2 C-terminal-like protein n=1 Tax=Ambystoma mexicanum TaxID=8296 RepID=UPI0037E81BE7